MNKKHILAIIIFGFLVYSNTLKNPYLWDDGLFIQSGNFIKKFENVKVFFSPKNYFKYTQDFTYRPMPFLAHIVNYKIWGINPVGHRLANVFFHIANAVLIYLLVFYLLKNGFVAFLSGLFFVVHPASTEVVNMVSFVETQLSTIFFLLAFIFYLKSKKFESVLCYFLAVFSKETAITLPAVIILYDLLITKNIRLKKYLPFFAVAVFYLVVRFLIFRHPTETMVKYPGDSFTTNIFVMLKAVPIYLSVIFLPFNLSVEHKIIIPTTFFQAPVIFGFLAVIIFVVISIYSYKKSKPVFFWLLFSTVTFLPTSNIIPMQNIIAERYLYLPLIGICVLLALFLEKIAGIGRRHLSAVYVAAFCIVIFFSGLTIIRNCDWKDDFTFYSKTLKQNPDSPGANINMATLYREKGNYIKAIEFVEKASAIDPYYTDNQFTLAAIFQDMGEYDRALELYEKISQEKKYQYYRAPFLNLGIIYKTKKQYNTAIECFKKAIELNPLSSDAYANFAEIFDMHGDIDRAAKLYKTSSDINPDDYISLNALGVYFGQKNLPDMSLRYLKKALKLKPDSAEINFNIGYAYFLLYRNGDALKMMEKVLKIDPNYNKAKVIISEILSPGKGGNENENVR